MVLLFIGPSGSGKDTQAELLAKKYGFEVISTGQLLRGISEGDDKIQTMIREALKEGFLNDHLVYGLLELYFKYIRNKNIIITGGVRKLTQVKLLDESIEHTGNKLFKVVNFDLNEENVIKRLSGRLYCPKCFANYHNVFSPPTTEGVCNICGTGLRRREDDNPESIKKRLNDYNKDIVEIQKEYTKRNLLVNINAEQTIEEIHEEVLKSLGLEKEIKI